MDPQAAIKAYWFDRMSDLVGQIAALQTEIAKRDARIAELEKANPQPQA